MRFNINSGAIRAWRLWLASLIAPAGIDIHDPDETYCLGFEPYLTAVAWNEIRVEDRKHLLDVSTDLDEMAGRYGLIDFDEHWHPYLTDKGVREVAKLWGRDRVPPWGGGLAECDTHGDYDLAPGDRKGCPRCAVETVLRRTVSGG